MKDEKSKVYYVIGSILSTDGTNSLLMNSPVWTGIFELEFGMNSSTTCAMMIRVSGLWGPKQTLRSSIHYPYPSIYLRVL
jgi:hypothetical protein